MIAGVYAYMRRIHVESVCVGGAAEGVGGRRRTACVSSNGEVVVWWIPRARLCM